MVIITKNSMIAHNKCATFVTLSVFVLERFLVMIYVASAGESILNYPLFELADHSGV